MNKSLLMIIFISNFLIAQNFEADFALYDPEYENDGVWEEEVSALKTMFFAYGWSYKIIDNNDLNNGELGSGIMRKYKALIMPGGWASYREIAITPLGKNYIRDFISSGGNYVGFCAGAFWASDTVDWAQNSSGFNEEYNLESDYVAYNYKLDLFLGHAKGPFGWTPWNDGTTASLQKVKINTSNSTMRLLSLPDTTRFFYYGGPFFTNLSSLPTNYEVWANAIAPDSLPLEAMTGNNEPTVVKFTYNLGTVILFSYHPEVLIYSDVDNSKLSQYINEDSLEFDTGNQSIDDINLDSWNIVHAALQIANNESVTKLTSLPLLASVKVFLEGSYDSSIDMMKTDINNIIPFTSPYNEHKITIGNIPADVVDWVLLQLKEKVEGNEILSRSLLLRRNGNLLRPDDTTKVIPLNVIPKDYYIVINHKNHLKIMSKEKLIFK